jgi:hypothetical protein
LFNNYSKSMKRILFFCILAIIGIAGYSQNNRSERTVLGMGTDYLLFPESLNGKIRELKEQNYWAVEKDGKVIAGELLTWKELDSIGSTKNFTAYFDKSGSLTKYDILGDDNKPAISTIGTYKDGKCVRWETSNKGKLTSYMTPEYDAKGFVIAGKVFNPAKDTLQNSYIVANDMNGNYTKIEFYNFRGIKTGYWALTYNPEGRVTEARYFNKSDTLAMSMKEIYNELGFMTAQDSYDPKTRQHSLWDMKTLTLDSKGNWIENSCNIDNGKFKIYCKRTYVYY